MWTRWHNADNTHPPAPAASVVLPTALKWHTYEYAQALSHDKAHATCNKAIWIREPCLKVHICVVITIFLLQTHYVTILCWDMSKLQRQCQRRLSPSKSIELFCSYEAIYPFWSIGGSTTLSYCSGWSPDVMSQRIVVATFSLNCLGFSGTNAQHSGTVIPAVYTAHLLWLYSSEWI